MTINVSLIMTPYRLRDYGVGRQKEPTGARSAIEDTHLP